MVDPGNEIDQKFPHALTLHLPLPTPRLVQHIATTLSVDRELSPFVIRTFSQRADDPGVLVVRYKATTARMLRVATNGMFEGLGLCLEVAGGLDVGALGEEGLGGK